MTLKLSNKNVVIDIEQEFSVFDILESDTLEQGHFDNLKFDNGKIRIWVSRMTTADGAEYNNEITIEELYNGNWCIKDRINPSEQAYFTV